MKETVLDRVSARMCTGCEACASVCPRNAITMKQDVSGFLHPVLSEEKCIHCGGCLQKCPVHTPAKVTKLSECKGYAGYSRDEALVQRSSSGAYFGVIASHFLQQGDAVVGVQWTSDFQATEHVLCDSLDQLKNIQGSKYLQSKKGSIYEDTIQHLRTGQKVLFTGCPCEVAAMANMCPAELQKRLYLLDFVCQGPTTPRAMSEYVQHMEKKYHSRIVGVNMRHAIGPWIPQYLCITFANKRRFLDRLYETPIGDAVRILQRESCYQCCFAGDHRASDITLGDYHGVETTDTCYHESGTSIMLVNTEKGQELLKIIQDSGACCENASYDVLALHNPRIDAAWEPREGYAVFSEMMQRSGLLAASDAVTSRKQKLLRKLPVHCRQLLQKLKSKLKPAWH